MSVSRFKPSCEEGCPEGEVTQPERAVLTRGDTLPGATHTHKYIFLESITSTTYSRLRFGCTLATRRTTYQILQVLKWRLTDRESTVGSIQKFPCRYPFTLIDGTFFYTCTQAYRVYIYDMTVPPVTSSKISQDTLSHSGARRNLYQSGGIRDTSIHNSS
ncbi:uncharacterized protein VP01_694g3 [Puccinia sorghi]|uniref:Uncharacterized protein n=1 Tax=Puccinia sorghi TaxID=27349 RepID=A0A0L6UE14_9BASI|nr:uncharacterized protein VP01_694g3 [Puccinia sorghi]